MAWAKVSSDLQHGPELRHAEVWSEEAANDSDKSLAVTTDMHARSVRIDGIRVEFTATATVGTREFTVQVLDSGSDVILDLNTDANITVVADASAVFELHSGSSYLAAIDGGPVRDYLPSELWLAAGMSLRVYDRNAVAAAADDMVVHIRAFVVR